MKNSTNYRGMTVGLGVGDRRTRYAVLDREGKLIAEDQFKTNRVTTAEVADRFAGATIILEVGAHSRWMSQVFEAAECKVYVANARQIKLIYASVDKDDRLDALRLAKLGMFDPDSTYLFGSKCKLHPRTVWHRLQIKTLGPGQS